MTTKLTFGWLSLLALTGLGWWLGHYTEGTWLLWTIILLSAIKGQWLIDHFMGLARGPKLFRAIVSGWLFLVLTSMALFL
ncbi:cytochrome C oxidase subunit IV family protein [Pseudomonas saliphila]|uniref:cytochrome C oxidase subunit IV family protein n=1 Tax=Pseudomonas saliphila TaxID=2586906 RepID=UPI001239CCFE|nr:cytochrome C oxidase subunit IV family protein [Pseudomonas saliphila]